MKKRGWKSKDTLWGAIRELEHYGFIQQTRQGGKHCCSLYGITWWAINECNGKLDVAETRTPSNAWKEKVPIFHRARKLKNKTGAPIAVLVFPEKRTNSQFIALKSIDIFALCPEDRTNAAASVPR